MPNINSSSQLYARDNRIISLIETASVGLRDYFAGKGIELSSFSEEGVISGQFFTLSAQLKNPDDYKKLTETSLQQVTDQDDILVKIKGKYIDFYFGLPEKMWEVLYLSDLSKRGAIGKAADGTEVILPLLELANPHELVGGQTNSGKSTLIKTSMLALMNFWTPQELGLVIADPKARPDYTAFDNCEHLIYKRAHTPEEIRALIMAMAEITRTRKDYGKTLVLVADEVGTDPTMSEPAMVEALNYIAQQGRAMNVHLLLGTQDWGPALERAKKGLGARVIGKVDSAATSVALAGIPQLGAEKLRGRGDFILATTGVRFQAAFPKKGDLNRLKRAEIPDIPNIEDEVELTENNAGGKRGPKAKETDPVDLAAAMVEQALGEVYSNPGLSRHYKDRIKKEASELLAELNKRDATVARKSTLESFFPGADPGWVPKMEIDEGPLCKK